MTIGDEIVLRVRSTPSGCKVIEFNGTGMAEGIASKRQRRYFYGDDANEKATEYAHRVGQDIGARVVELGERI